MKLTEHLRRILSALLVFMLLFSMMPVPASAASIVDTAIIFSDLHTNKSDYKESTLKNVLTAMKSAGLSASSVTSAGDAFSVNEDSSSSNGPYTGYTGTLTGYIQNVLGNVPVNYVWSDHDRYAVEADGSTLLDKTSHLVYGAGNDGVYGTDDDANYYVYSLSMGDLCSYDRYNAGFNYTASSSSRASKGFTATVDQAIANFKSEAAVLKKDRPLFIVSHQPLFDNRNDNAWAENWFDAINVVAKEMDVAFFYGHNHKYDTGSDYYYAKGSTMPVATADGWNYKYETGVGWKPSIDLKSENKTLNFSHMCAGYLAPSSTGSTSSTTRQGVALGITIYEDSIRYATYNSKGLYTGSYSLDVTVKRDFANVGETIDPTEPEVDPTEPGTEPTIPETEPTVPEIKEEGAIWRKASTITNGKKYLLVNFGYNASGTATYAINGNAAATEVEVLSDNTGAYIVSDDQSLAWTAEANNGQFEMANAETGKYLRAANYVYGTSGSDISVNNTTSSGSTYTNWSMETKSGKTILAVRRATSDNYYPVRYNGSKFQAFNSSQLSTQNNWMTVFEETGERAAHEHVFETVTVAATCTEAGFITTKCTICGEETVETIEALGHTNETITVESTCTEAGSITTKCTVCGEETVETTEALGHKYESVTTDATCAADGSKVYTCTVCGHSYTETIPATGDHAYRSETVEATCTETGSVTYICDVCGTSYVEVIAAQGHSYENFVTVATCTEDGYTTYTCTVCGHSYQGETVEAFGHTYDSVITATCTESGFVVYTCETCGHSYNGEEVAAYGHSYETTTVAPTCATAGYTTYICKNCGHTYTGDETAALGHAYSVEVTEATCTEAGFTTYTCSACDHSYVGDNVAALGHDYESVVTEPTFETEGFTTHTCTVCGDVKVDSFVPVLSHTYETVTTEATCTEDGSVVHTCVDCGYSYTEVLPALGHTNETVTTEATCTESGSIVTTCTVCGERETEWIAALGHSYETTTIDPTCTEVGFITKTCLCGDVVTQEIPATGHAYSSRYTAPTCTENGGTTYTCACGDVYTEVEAALGHSYETTSVAPTCTTTGYTTYTCATCGDSYVADKIAALGHSYESVVTKATCTAAGYTTHTCTVCGDNYTDSNVAALGHSYNCVESDGYLVYTCDACGHNYSEKIETLSYTKVSSISSDNSYVITLVSGNKYYALSHKNNTISAAGITVVDDKITSEITEDLIWTYSDNKLSYISNGSSYYLYAQSNNWWGGWWNWWGNWGGTPTLTLSTSNSTTVNFSSNTLKMGNYYLCYSNGTVSLNSSATTTYFFIEK